MNPFGWDLGHMCNEATLEYSRSKFDWPYYQYNSNFFPTDDEMREVLRAYILFDKNDPQEVGVKGAMGEEW